ARTLLLSAAAALCACDRKSITNPAANGPTAEAVALVKSAAVLLTGSPSDYDALIASIGNARVVLLGESTHGTHEFFVERARISQRLFTEKGFNAIAIEGDWPDAYRVNQ